MLYMGNSVVHHTNSTPHVKTAALDTLRVWWSYLHDTLNIKLNTAMPTKIFFRLIFFFLPIFCGIEFIILKNYNCPPSGHNAFWSGSVITIWKFVFVSGPHLWWLEMPLCRSCNWVHEITPLLWCVSGSTVFDVPAGSSHREASF